MNTTDVLRDLGELGNEDSDHQEETMIEIIPVGSQSDLKVLNDEMSSDDLTNPKSSTTQGLLETICKFSLSTPPSIKFVIHFFSSKLSVKSPDRDSFRPESVSDFLYVSCHGYTGYTDTDIRRVRR